MYLQNFTRDFSILGLQIDAYVNGVSENFLLNSAISASQDKNPFFTAYMQKEALKAISHCYLREEILSAWLCQYADKIAEREQWAGVIMAGNIPLVGFYDFISVLGAGYKAMIKLSSKDCSLLPAIVDMLTGINRYWKDRISFVQVLENVSMIIAAGHNETMSDIRRRHTDIPLLLRGHRASIAVIRGSETDDCLRMLASDIFLYFGMGCRSVSAILVPEGYDFCRLTVIFSEMAGIVDINNFRAAYKYQKAQSLMDGAWFIDGGFFILREENTVPPPVSVIGVRFYKNIADVESYISDREPELQCVVNYNFRGNFTHFGHSQRPKPEDYQNGVNNMAFILKNY